MTEHSKRLEDLEQEVIRLKQQLKTVTEEMLRAYEEINLAFKVAKMFGRSLHLPKVNSLIMQIAIEISNAEIGWIFVKKHRKIRTPYRYKIRAEVVDEINSNFAEKILAGTEPLIINDLAEHIKINKKWDIKPIAFIGVPFVSQEKSFGGLCLCKLNKKEFFPTTEAKLLQLLCDHSVNTFEAALRGQDLLNQIKGKVIVQ